MGQPLQARMLMGARAWMIAEAREQTNIHTEVQARMLAGARSQTFILRVRTCMESSDRIFLLKIQACMKSRPRMIPR